MPRWLEGDLPPGCVDLTTTARNAPAAWGTVDGLNSKVLDPLQ
jgi:hypothetical protein